LLKRYFRFFKNFDWLLFVSAVLLLGFSVAIIYSTTFSISGGSEALQQAGYAIGGILILFLVARFDYRILKNMTGILYVLTIGMLLLTEFMGQKALGAQRWINLGFFQFQPSEIAKVFMVIILAKYFSENVDLMNRWQTVLKSAIFAGIPTILVAIQPDLGTAMTFMVIWVSMLFISNFKKIYFLAMGLVFGVLSPVVYQFLHDYHKKRILTFINPTADPMGSGWNVNQAMIAIGSGQFWGRGLGHGPQSQLNFVPFKHTDFVFAALAEEMGFVGALAVIALFAVILFRAIRIAQLSRDYFGMYLATGIFAFLFFHIFINIGMNLGIVPVTGIPLPLVSSGGTSIVITLFSIGILESIYSRYKKIDF
jgi:rod shape determining protein RodA